MNTRRIAALTAAAVTGLTAMTGVVGFGITQSSAASQAACSVSSTTTVQHGSRGTAVKSVQCILNRNGANLVTDGIFGPKTKAAVLSFQRSQGLVVDGIVGPKTWAALKSANGGTTTPPTTPPPSNGNVSAARQQVLQRAATWLTAYNGGPVPYSQSRYFQGYRQDCSGFASMALELGKPGLNTVGLAATSVTRRISLNELKPGDLLIDSDGTNNTRHVVIFEKWTDSGHTAYWAYEQTGDGDRTRHRMLKYGLDSGSQYVPRRPLKYGD